MGANNLLGAQKLRSIRHATFESSQLLPTSLQVIGNKWDTYLDLLQAGYSEQ
jgi:hypothetical protein